MCAPLFDDKGIVRYFIGAQVDVSGLVEEGRGIESFRALLQSDVKEEGSEDTQTGYNKPVNGHSNGNGHIPNQTNGAHSEPAEPGRVKSPSWFEAAKNQTILDRLRELSLMFSQDEAEVVTKHSRDARITDEYGLPAGATDNSTDSYSISSGYAGHHKPRGQGKRVIGSDAGVGGVGFDLAQLSLHNTLPAPSLPGVYKNVSRLHFITTFPIHRNPT